jgi:hypothetical protein
MFSFTPDWDLSGTAEELQKQIGNGFKFNGPGFYLTDSDTLLIIPRRRGDKTQITVENVWCLEQPKGTLFSAHCFNSAFSDMIFSGVATTPVREDTRECH